MRLTKALAGSRSSAIDTPASPLTFRDQYATAMPRTMLRYALEHFPPETRKHYLSL